MSATVLNNSSCIQHRMESTATPLDLLTHSAARTPSHPALEYLCVDGMGEPEVLSYEQLLGEVKNVVRALSAHGIQAHESVAIMLPFVPQAVSALIAASTVAVAFPVNLLLSAEALRNQLVLSGCRVVITMGPHPDLDVRARLQVAIDAMTDAPLVVEIPVEAGSSEAMSWDEFLGHSDGLLPNSDADHVGMLIHTGGTTGLPKLARLTRRNVASASIMAASGLGIGARERLLTGLPLFHVGGAIDALFAALSVGGTVVFPSMFGMRSRRAIQEVWSIIEREKITLLAGVPTTLAAIVETPVDGAKLDGLRAVMTGGSPLARDLFLRLQAKIEKPVCQLYGMTESSGIATAQLTSGQPVSHTTGKPVPGVDICLGSIDGGFHPGAKGEILVRGPNVFRGYLTAEGVKGDPNGGWFQSGDLGEVTEDGELRVVGRSKDVIIRSGHNIDPQMIEDVAMEHPDVIQSAAVGMPDDYAGEVPVLYVVTCPGATVSVGELAKFINARIAEPPARPKHVFLLDELPLTPFAKIARFRLRQLAVEHRANELVIGLLSGALVTCTDPAAKKIQIKSDAAITQGQLDEIEKALAKLDLQLAD